jgi:autotransporter-associated beta strand protein
MRTGRLKKLLGTWAALIGCGIAILSTAQAQVYWNGGTGNWSDAANWTGGTPDVASNVVFNVAGVNGAETITLSGINSANSLTFNNTGATVLSSGTLQLGSGGMTFGATSGAVTLNLTLALMASQTWTFNTTANSIPVPTVFKVDDSVVSPITLTLYGGKSSSYFGNFTDGANASLSVVYDGGVSLQMKSAQTYSGTSTLRNAYIRLDNAVAMNGGLGSNQNVLVDSTGAAGVTVVTGASGTVNYNFNVTAGSSSGLTLTNINASANTTWNGNIALSNTLTISGSATNVYNGVISGTGSVYVNNATNLILNGVNTYTGQTTILSGAVTVASMSAFGNATDAIAFGAGGNNKNYMALTYTGAGEIWDRAFYLNFGGNRGSLTLNANGSGAWVIAPDFVTTNNNAKDLILSGSNVNKNEIQGNIVLTNLNISKQGAGTWVLSGSNTYGTTTVSAGTLLINGDSSKATGAVSVASGAKFGGSGIIGGATTINSGAILVPGADNSIGTLTLKSGLTLNDGSILNFDLGGALGDKIVINGGSFTSGGISTIDLNVLSGLTVGTYILLDWSSVTGSTVSLSNFVLDTDSSTIGTLSLSGNSLVLNVTVIPEPSTWVLMTVGVVVLAWTVRRRAAKV